MATRQTIFYGIAAATLPAVGASPLVSALFALRVSSPAVVFLTTLSLLPSKPLSPPSPSPITPVVVQSRVPRKSLILFLLSLAALSFLVDGIAYVAYAIFNRVWTPGTGVELASLLGLITYSALAALGAYKDVNNIEIWSRKRVKAAIFVALALDIAQVVLLVLSAATRDPRKICDSSQLSKCIPETIHFLTPLFRAICLVPLFVVLLSPRVVYLPAELHPEVAEAEGAPLVGQSGVLLQEESTEAVPGGESGKYGTFTAHGHLDSGNVVTIRQQSGSSLAILWRLGPYILPAKSLILSITLLHTLTRVITPLVPLSLGAALNTFLTSSSVPISTPLGTSPYTYIFVFTLLHLLVSNGGIPNLTKTLVSRLGASADDILSSHYTDHVFGLALGPNKIEVPEDLHATANGAITKVLDAVLVLGAVIDDDSIGAVVLAVLFGWEFGLAVLIALGIYGYVICLTYRPSVPSAWAPALAFIQALLASGALLLGSLYIAKGVTEDIWSPGAWVAWIWYWGVLFLPLTWTPSLRVATGDIRSIFRVLDKPAGVIHGKGVVDGSGGIEIKFDNVSLTYPYTDTEEPVPTLDCVSFVLPVSSITAVISAPGSTKSSISKALYRLYDVDSGTIYLNGVPIPSFSLASLRSLIAAVPDVCSEDRTKALSRALYKDAKVILIQGSLDRALIGNRTVVWEVGTSGLDGVEGVDQILVFKDGQIVESGPFKDLVRTDGLFASLWADHIDAGAPVPGSSATASGAAEGYDISLINAQPSETGNAPVADAFISDSPRAVAASDRAPTASIRAPSIKPTASTKADSIAPSVPTKDFPAFSFPSAPEGPGSVPSDGATSVAFPASSAPAPIAFPKSEDSRSIDSGSQTHVRLPTAITFDTVAVPPRVSTPDPTGAPSSSSTPDAEGKRKRISSQNFQRLARRISLSAPKKGVGIQGIPGIAGIAGVLRRDASVKFTDKNNDESGVKDSTDAGGSSSAPETARNSGETSTERTEKDKEREEKKRKRKSFMEVVGARWGDSSAVATPPAADSEPQGEA